MTRRAGARGTKRLVGTYGERLVCVRFRYDAERMERIKTVELIVERVERELPVRADPDEAVYVRLLPGEALLRRSVLQNGGRWDERSGLWRITRATATSLGLLARRVRAPRGPTGGASKKNHR
ncbi:MAG: hypothetical protein WA208_10470 [Thermoanaerobaculia bacterium]